MTLQEVEQFFDNYYTKELKNYNEFMESFADDIIYLPDEKIDELIPSFKKMLKLNLSITRERLYSFVAGFFNIRGYKTRLIQSEALKYGYICLDNGKSYNLFDTISMMPAFIDNEYNKPININIGDLLYDGCELREIFAEYPNLKKGLLRLAMSEKGKQLDTNTYDFDW